MGEPAGQLVDDTLRIWPGVHADIIALEGANERLGHTLEAMYAIRRQLEAIGIRKIIFVGPSPHWRYDLPSIILRTAWKETPRYLATGLEPDVLDRDRELKRDFKNDRSSRYVSLIDLFCTARGCMTYIGDDRRLGITTFDYGHVTVPASEMIARRILVAAITE